MRVSLAALLLAIVFPVTADALHPSCKYRPEKCKTAHYLSKLYSRSAKAAKDESDSSSNRAEQQREARIQKMKEAAEQTRCQILQTC